MTTRVLVSTFLEATPDDVWAHASTHRLFKFVTAPMMRFDLVEPAEWPEAWEEGEYVCSMKFFGVLPVGRQVIGISYPEPEGETRFLRDNGRSASIKTWDHWVSISPEGDGTRYEDRLDLDAGWRTPLVAAFARRFYRHRQARWRKLVASGFRYEEAA